MAEKKQKRRGRPPGVKNKVTGKKYPADIRKKTFFAKYINKYASRTLRELRELLKDVEDRAAIEVMALRALLRAAEGDSTPAAINLVLSATSPIAVNMAAKAAAAEQADPELPDPSEFAPAGED